MSSRIGFGRFIHDWLQQFVDDCIELARMSVDVWLIETLQLQAQMAAAQEEIGVKGKLKIEGGGDRYQAVPEDEAGSIEPDESGEFYYFKAPYIPGHSPPKVYYVVHLSKHCVLYFLQC